MRLPQRRPKAGVEGRPETLVLPVADDGEMKAVAVSVDVIGGAVGGAVVDEDHSRAELVRARAEILEQAADVLGLVEGWNDEPDHGRPINGARRAELSSQPLGRPHLLALWWERHPEELDRARIGRRVADGESGDQGPAAVVG